MKRVTYIYSERLRKDCDRLPQVTGRATYVQDLINSYRLLSHKELFVVESLDATEDELKLFHSSYFVDFLKKVNNVDGIENDFKEYEDEALECGLAYDCPILKNHYDLVSSLAGGSLTAAKLLVEKKCRVAINWFGGWHHAQRDSAEGFCYVNDIVLAIQKLTEQFTKVLYVDLDIHHGDGVQNAFEFSEKILTLSLHKLSPGFYPGTGSLKPLDSTTHKKGKYHSLNVPFKDGVSSKTYWEVFHKIVPTIMEAFKPDAIVIQCGADSLNGDKIGESNLTVQTIGRCVELLLGFDRPTMLLGGGGYNFANAARLWTYLTSVVLREEISDDIPDCSEFFEQYGPGYELFVGEGLQKDQNTESYVKEMIDIILSYCDCIRKT